MDFFTIASLCSAVNGNFFKFPSSISLGFPRYDFLHRCIAPNIYYLGYAGVITVNGVRICGISGIFKGYNYKKGHFDIAPYSKDTKRSVYHIRSLEFFRLRQLTPKIDVMLSHDWPTNITDHGNVEQLMRFKPYFREDIENKRLGSPPCEDLLMELKPKHWFSAHLHCKFTAQLKHDEDQVTDFIALDKCVLNRNFLEIVEIGEPVDPKKGVELSYDLEWLAILFMTKCLENFQSCETSLPFNQHFTPTEEDKSEILEKFKGDLKIPLVWGSSQTTQFCEKLGFFGEYLFAQLAIYFYVLKFCSL